MNFLQAEAEIRKHFDTLWANQTEIAWPDQKFDIPTDKSWVRFTSQENEGGQVSIGSPGNNRFRSFGLVSIQVFQPGGQGSIEARTLATAALGAFKGKQTANGIEFFDAYARQVGTDEKGWYQINVFASFYYDELT